MLHRDVVLTPLPPERHFRAPDASILLREAYLDNVSAMARACLLAYESDDPDMAALFSKGLLVAFAAS